MSTSATASGNSSAGTTGSAKDAGNLGNIMRRLGSLWWGLPLFNTRSFWSLRPPAPAAAWSETLKIILQQGRGGCGDERAGASATTSISHQSPIPGKSTPPKHRQSLCLHPRGTQDRHTQNTTRPKKHGEVFNFRSGRKGLAARLMVGLVRGSNVGCPGATPPGAHNPGTPISIGVHACSP